MIMSFWIHLSTGLLLAGLPLLLAGRRSVPVRVVLVLLSILVGFLPIGNTDLAGLIVAHTEILSVSSIVTLIYLFRKYFAGEQKTKQGGKPPKFGQILESDQAEVYLCLTMFFVAGMILYASALGFMAFDVYAAGFDHQFAWVVLAVAVVFGVKGYWLPAFCLVFAVIGFGCRIAGSPNVWNYMVDPWLVLMCGVRIFAYLWHRIVSGRTSLIA